MTTSAILPVVSAIAHLIEDDDEVVDWAGAQPREWVPGRTYVYPSGRLVEDSFETGTARRQDFGVTAVFLAPSDEAALRRSDADISELIDAKRSQYLERVRRRPVSALWGWLHAAERPAPETLEGRGVAIDITGWRLVQ